jgi:hypothetical protein
MKQDDAVADHGGAGKSLSDLLPPHDLWTRGSPRVGKGRSGVRAVTGGTKELWPVGVGASDDGDGKCRHTPHESDTQSSSHALSELQILRAG